MVMASWRYGVARARRWGKVKEGAKTAIIVISILLSMVAIYVCTRMLEDE